ncbi:transglutaminase family protein [Salinarimonas ramus]|uniref:Transglutaminase n=1 Tax=Salinarimonas ramus TaxID=690164 RepID=A0A917QAM9_9HYPH|nr:transglutaminase family protein [Salinarimonas ramus]GGK39411.1 transglutaminase [Salinarimonas ramus]
MIYRIRHVTTYTYEASVASARCVLRLTPREGAGQERLFCDVRIAPEARLREETCFFGARLHHADIDVPHRELRIEARARVRVTRAVPRAPADDPRVAAIRAAAAAGLDRGADAPVQALFPSQAVPRAPEIADWARASLPDEAGTFAGVTDLMRRIHADFAYAPGETDVATPAREAFRARKGVCQDFAHVMIAGLRGLGLPARYVSGYLRTIPPEGRPRLVGADATHAWVEAWCGPGLGWVGFDPTNALLVGPDHIVLAVGRDYADVSPVDGVVVSSGGQSLSVSVDVMPEPGEAA